MKQIRILLIFFLCFTAAWTLSCTKQETGKTDKVPPAPDRPLDNPIEGFAAYRFPRFPARVQYPKDWQVREDKIGVAFILPGTASDETLLEGATILVETMYGELLSVEEYKKRIIADLKKRTIDFKLIESKETTLGGEPAYLFSYSGLFEETWMRFTSVYCIARGLLAVASYSAEDSRYDEHLPTVLTIFGSFEFL